METDSIMKNLFFSYSYMLIFLLSSAQLSFYLCKSFTKNTVQHLIVKHLKIYCTYLLISNAFHFLEFSIHFSNDYPKLYLWLYFFFRSVVPSTMFTLRLVTILNIKKIKRYSSSPSDYPRFLRFVTHHIIAISISLFFTLMAISFSEQFLSSLLMVGLPLHTTAILVAYFSFIKRHLRIKMGKLKPFVDFSLYWRTNIMFFFIPSIECVIFWISFGIIMNNMVNDAKWFLDCVLNIVFISEGCLIGMLFASNKNEFDIELKSIQEIVHDSNPELHTKEQVSMSTADNGAEQPINLGINLNQTGLKSMEENAVYNLNLKIGSKEQIDELPRETTAEQPINLGVNLNQTGLNSIEENAIYNLNLKIGTKAQVNQLPKSTNAEQPINLGVNLKQINMKSIEENAIYNLDPEMSTEEQVDKFPRDISAEQTINAAISLRQIGLESAAENATLELNPEISTEEQVDMLQYDKKWEFPREKLKLGMLLGCGAFGNVRKAEAIGITDNTTPTTVAVKTVKLNVDRLYIRALVSELKIMIYIGKHLNVVNLLGACTTDLDKHELAVIVEYCKYGNLKDFLLKRRDEFIDQINEEGDIDYSIGIKQGETNSYSAGNSKDIAMAQIRTVDLIHWCYQIAKGMEYLASRKVLHGDLAARNVLMAEGNIIKICDFGLSKNMYKYDNYTRTKSTLLPFKWMAIESIRDSIFSTQSDVWSFGITMWELFSLSAAPYPGICNFKELYDMLESGYRMEKPCFAFEEIYAVMKDCWDSSPTRRPTFTKLIHQIGGMLRDNVEI